MKKFFVVILMMFLVSGIAYSAGYEIKKKAGEYNVGVEIDRNPPITGNNNMAIEIKDMSENYVTNAKVSVEYSMPAMPGMPAMNYKSAAELENKKYKAVINLPASGSWNVVIKITREGKTARVKFSIDAQ